jgi:hypothetical protein
MPKKSPGPSVKDKDLYEKLRDEGNSKNKSARIANAAAATSRTQVGRKGGKSPDYDKWKRDELEAQAKKVGITGRSKMKKKDLITALREH